MFREVRLLGPPNARRNTGSLEALKACHNAAKPNRLPLG